MDTEEAVHIREAEGYFDILLQKERNLAGSGVDSAGLRKS